MDIVTEVPPPPPSGSAPRTEKLRAPNLNVSNMRVLERYLSRVKIKSDQYVLIGCEADITVGVDRYDRCLSVVQRALNLTGANSRSHVCMEHLNVAPPSLCGRWSLSLSK